MKDKTKTYGIILGVVLFILLISGLTYAILTWSSGKINLGLTSACFDIYYDKGQDITGVLNPSTSYTGGLSASVKFNIKSGCTDGYGKLYLVTDDTTSTNLYREGLLNYQVVKDGVATDLKGTISSSGEIELNIGNLTKASSASTTYKIYVWIDDALVQNSDANSKYSGKIRAEAYQGKLLTETYKLTNSDGSTYTPTYTGSGTKVIRSTADKSKFIEVKVDNKTVDSSNYTVTEGSTVITFKEAYLKTLSSGNHTVKIVSTDGYALGSITIKEKETIAKYITNLYNNSTKTTVTNNSITYQYDTSHSLMKDVGNNIRYYGASPNNYVYFNCSDYSNQSSSTCEAWRIIGVFDGKVKLMRNESISNMAYDNDEEDTYLKSIDYNNNESVALLLSHSTRKKEKIIKLAGVLELGGGDNDYSTSSLQKILNNYYYNSQKYTGNSTYDFTSTGIKNDTTRNMISDNNYSLLGWTTDKVYADQIYEYERSIGSVYSEHATSWTGKIALAYPSDYGYAVDLGKCTVVLGSYSDSTCTSNNWMKSILGISRYGWLLTPNSGSSYGVWLVYSTGGVDNSSAYNACGVTPVLFLSSDASVKMGTGTSSDPYQLLVN